MPSNNLRPEGPCVKCGRRTASEGYICQRCKAEAKANVRKKKPRACLECKGKTWAKSQVCRPCATTVKEVEEAEAESVETGVKCTPSPTYLCDGRWVPRGGILRWEAA